MDDESGSSYYFLSLGVVSLFLKMDLVFPEDIDWISVGFNVGNLAC